MTKTTYQSIYKELSNKIIVGLQEKSIDFEMPFKRMQNAMTGSEYNGRNVMILGFAGFKSPYWATYKQWQEKGAQVNKGEKASTIIYFGLYEKKEADEEQNNTSQKSNSKYSRVCKLYKVFNAEQVTGWDSPVSNFDFNDNMQDFLNYTQNTKAVINESFRASYSLLQDYIDMPSLSSFKGQDDREKSNKYCYVLAHELIHWTGAKHRNNRNLDLIPTKTHPKYAFEELVAEIGAAFLIGRFNMSHTLNMDNLAYIQTWIKELGNNTQSYLHDAIKEALKAIDYLDSLQPNQSQQAA